MESDASKGTWFWVELPLTKVEGTIATTAATTVQPALLPHSVPTPKTRIGNRRRKASGFARRRPRRGTLLHQG